MISLLDTRTVPGYQVVLVLVLLVVLLTYAWQIIVPRFDDNEIHSSKKSSSFTTICGHLLPDGTPTKSSGAHAGFAMVK